VKVVEDVVVKKFTFAISSPDEFLVVFIKVLKSTTLCIYVFCALLLWGFSAPGVSVVCVFMSVPGTWSVRLVSDSCIHRLCPLTLNQGTVPHSVPWSGVVCRRGWLVVVWHCNVLRQYPSLFAAVLFIVWLKIVLDCHSLMLREYHFTVTSRHPSYELDDFVGAKFYCLHALADSN